MLPVMLMFRNIKQESCVNASFEKTAVISYRSLRSMMVLVGPTK